MEELLPAQVEMLKQELTLEVIRSDDFVSVYSKVDLEIARLTELKKAADASMKKVMREEYLRTGNQTIKAGNMSVTFVPGGVREAFDAKAFKEENPDMYSKYVKTSATAEALRVKVKGE